MYCVAGVPEQQEDGMHWHVSPVFVSPDGKLSPVGSYDFNDHLGAENKDFLGEHKGLREKMDKAWAAWAEENMTDDEGSDNEEVRKPRRTKVTTKKEKIKFRYSKEGEPLLPHGCLEGTLDDKKSLVRSFLTAHYGESGTFLENLGLMCPQRLRKE
jgi:hypothetical protein